MNHRQTIPLFSAAVALCLGQTLAAAEPDQLVCGFENVEDLVDVQGTHWMIGSGIGGTFFQEGALHLFDKERATGRRLMLDIPAGAKASAPYDECPAPPDPKAFSAHGISLVSGGEDGAYRLFVVNHGGRESIEIFDVAVGGNDVALRWSGCVLTPDNTITNSVAGKQDGSLVLSASVNADRPVPSFHAMGLAITNGQATPEEIAADLPHEGAVYTWSRANGWKPVPGSALPGNNGIELSRDGKWAFVDAWNDGSVTKLPLEPHWGEKRTVSVGFRPDNIRWGDNGRLVAAGQVDSAQDVMQCVTGTGSCALDYRAVEIDPQTMTATPLFDGQGSAHFGTATVALRSNDALWLGSARSDCIARVDLSDD